MVLTDICKTEIRNQIRALKQMIWIQPVEATVLLQVEIGVNCKTKIFKAMV